MAPSDIKFAQTPVAFIKIKANNKESGIMEAVSKPPRKLPNNKTNTNTTINAPSIKFFETVPVVRAIKSLWSKNGLI
jgi:hypothetical protein